MERNKQMNIIRYQTLEPGWVAFNPLVGLRRELSRFMANPFLGFHRQSDILSDWTPAVDVLEDTKNLYVEAELPGVKKEDIAISLVDDVLSISVQRSENDQKEEQVHRSERYFGRCERSITLPKPVTAAQVNATYKDGVLKITLPKTEEAQPRQIQVVAA